MSQLFVVSVILLAVIGCVPDDSTKQPVAAPPPTGVDAEAVSGTYEVEGVTVRALTGQQREIKGTMRLDVEGPRYEVSFNLGTISPDFGEPTPVRVRGTGRGFVVGGIFTSVKPRLS